MHSNIFDKLSFLSLFLVIILLPFFFLPFTNIPIENSKGALLVIGLVFCIIFWAIARFSDGKISLPKSLGLLGGAGVVLSFLLSAVFSKTSQVSFFGTMFDIGTFWFIFSSFLLMLMSAIIFRDPKRMKMVLFGSMLSGIAVLIFQSVHLFLPKFLSLGFLVEKTDNLLGSWNAFGIFIGFFALMLLFLVEFFPTKKMEKLIFQILIIFSIILIAVVNFPFVWILLGIATLIIVAYKVSTNLERTEEREKKAFPLTCFIVGLISLLFFLNPLIPISNPVYLGNVIPNLLHISNTEVSPSFGATMLVTKSVLKKDPVFGIGPNKFGTAWSMYKPTTVNSTVFWNTVFSSGSGLLPTFATTTGILGIVSWLIFFTLFIMGGVKSIFSSIKNGTNRETMAFFVLSFYLFVACFFYSGGAVVFLLAMAFAGIFLGLFASNHKKGEILISFLDDHRKSFFSILFLIVIIIFSAAVSFKYIERLTSLSYFRKALVAPKVPEAESAINKALALYVNDLYLRAYVQVYLVKLNALVGKNDSTLSDTNKADLQTNLSQAINGARLAIAFNSTNYLNLETLGSIYQVAGSLGVKDAYDSAIEQYKIASTLNPFNPGIKLAIANTYFQNGKNKDAKDYANTALSLKGDYVDALILLSRIARSEGSNTSALSYAQTALSFLPDNKDLLQYIDSLRSSNSSSADSSGTTTDKTKNSSNKKN